MVLIVRVPIHSSNFSLGEIGSSSTSSGGTTNHLGLETRLCLLVTRREGEQIGAVRSDPIRHGSKT